MILKLDENNAILDFFIGNDTPLFTGVEYDESTLDVEDFVSNWFLYSYADGKLYKDEAKVSAYQAEQAEQEATMQELINNPTPTAQEQINAMLMREIASLKAQVTLQ